MERTEQNKPKARWRSIILMAVGIIGIVAFGARMALSSNVDTEKIEKSMTSAANEMSGIKSKAGTSIDEAYYQAEGKYLAQESKAWEVVMNSAVSCRFAVDMMGILASVALFISGSRMKG